MEYEDNLKDGDNCKYEDVLKHEDALPKMTSKNKPTN